MTIAVVDSGGANIASVVHALRRLGAEPVFTGDGEEIRKADRVILPGVGAASVAMRRLREHGLTELIPALSQPVLGVCLGMQLLFDYSDEGKTKMLGVIPGRIKRFPDDPSLRTPHMGWNNISTVPNFSLDKELDDKWFYFVHSYFAPVTRNTVATANHGIPFSAMVQHNNFMGAQFHPERSAQAGARLLKRFMEGAA